MLLAAGCRCCFINCSRHCIAQPAAAVLTHNLQSGSPACPPARRLPALQVCRHHAAILAEGSGTASCFRCPYHGWAYGLDGRLQKATRLKGIQGFRAAEHGLLPLAVEQWGGFVWVCQAGPPAGGGQQQGQAQQEEQQQQQEEEPGAAQGVAAWLGRRGSEAALAAGVGDELAHVASREYRIDCNWKVFADNYLVSNECCRELSGTAGCWPPAAGCQTLRSTLCAGCSCSCRFCCCCCCCCCSCLRHCLLALSAAAAQDGGYHVGVAHPELASGLDLPTYRSALFERLSIQSCQTAGAAAAGAAGAARAARAAGAAGAAGEERQGGSSRSANTSSSAGQADRQLQRRLGGGRPPAYTFIYPNLMLNRRAPGAARLTSGLLTPRLV